MLWNKNAIRRSVESKNLNVLLVCLPFPLSFVCEQDFQPLKRSIHSLLVDDTVELDIGLACFELLDDVLEAIHHFALGVFVRVVCDELHAGRIRERRLGLFLRMVSKKSVQSGEWLHLFVVVVGANHCVWKGGVPDYSRQARYSQT